MKSIVSEAVGKKNFLHIPFLLALLLLFSLPPLRAVEKTFTVVIDAGHGGKDPGAMGTTMKEKDINLSVSLKLGKIITDKHPDVEVVYTRKTDKFIDLNVRADIANKNKADLFISIHTNAIARKTVKGTETYTLGLARSDENLEVAMRENSAILLEDDYMQKYEGFDPKSTESYIIFEFMQNRHMEQSVSFASEIQKGFVKMKRTDRGVRQAGFLVLRKTSMPSVLIELGYISNREEENYMKSATGQKQLTDVIYGAFSKYKREYDRKQGGLPDGLQQASQNRQEQKPASVSTANVVYKIQILTSDKQLPANSKQFKGYKNVSYYVENGRYKYTYGESTRLDEMRKLRQSVLKDFKDAFIISFKDGKRIVN